MSTAAQGEIIISVDTVDQLFNGSGINPFSEKAAVILGEPGIEYAIKQELSRGLRAWKGKRLVIRIPASQLTPGVDEQVEHGVRNFARAKLARNEADIRLSRVRSLTGLVMAVVIAGILLTILEIFLSTVFAAASDTVKGLLAGLVTIFVWSTVWNPWDRLVYEWLEPWRENRILRNLLTMEIEIQQEVSA
jgi:hypothetical protein